MSLDVGGILLAALLAAAVAVAVAICRRRSRAPEPDVEAAPVEVAAWEPEREVRKVLETSTELRELYERLGYSLPLEWECERLLAELKGLIRVEIPDYPAFRRALDEIESGLAASGSGDGEASSGGRYRRANDPLLREVLAVRHDRELVLAILRRNPVEEALPFVEQVPVKSRGRVIWRTPVELAILRKRPADDEAFARRLSELDRLVRSSRLRRPEEDRDGVLESLARAGRDLRRDNAYLPTSILAVAGRLEAWLRGSLPAPVRARRAQLEGLLAASLELRHRFAPESHPPQGLEPERLEGSRRSAQELADTYRREAWLQVPALTHLVLHNLLVAELAPYPHRERRRPGSPGGVLAVVCGETATGHFDPAETARRLHGLEARGVYVHSLVFALLRLSGPGPEAPMLLAKAGPP